MDLLKTVTGKVVGGAIALAVVAGGISWWQMDETARQMLLGGAGRIVAWFAIVLTVPWVTFFVIGRVAKLESNFAGGVLVLSYTMIEVGILGWLFDWSIAGPTAWTFVAAGGLLAAVYNLFTCDWIAEKIA
jgi:hypothetical protein